LLGLRIWLPLLLEIVPASAAEFAAAVLRFYWK
jgi:hypothetical protein